MSEDLASEVRSLRAELRHTRRLLAIAILGVSAAGLVAAARPHTTVQASRFELVDDAGQVQGLLEAFAGGTQLVLIGPDGDIVRLSATAGRSDVALYRDGFRPGAAARLSSTENGARLRLGDAFNNPRVDLGTVDDAQWVRVNDASGTVRAELGGYADREQGLFVGDPHGGPALSLFTDREATKVDLGAP